jgi:DNA-binding NtrC family response regulator
MEGQSIRSVIVDDDKTIGEILKELVSREHTSVDVFSDGFEAIQFVKRQPVDIVITDLIMPGIGGLEVLRQAKITNPDVIVIIITGHASLETAMEAVREGAYDYIKKPFKLEEMGIAFNNALERVQLVRENKCSRR